MRMMARLMAASLLVRLCVIDSTAQEQPPILEAAFEAATFKRNVAGGDMNLNAMPTGRFAVANFPMATLITAAYQLQQYSLVGAPDWTRNERYDIVAKLDPQIAGRSQPDGHPPIWALALRRLLADRTRLVFHRETQQRPIYALVMARANGALGPNLKQAEFDCDALREDAVAAARAGLPSPYPAATPTRVALRMRNAPGRIVVGGSALPEFLAVLARQLGRPIVDRSGLSGRWDFVLTYTPENRIADGAAPDATAPDLFTALQEQLGLKLEPTEGPVNVLVVDHIERPTAD
jgi:uncharacterized protein (TIGR03435 family)